MSTATVILIFLGALVVLAICWVLVDDARWFRLARRNWKQRRLRIKDDPAFQPDRIGPWS